jgi:hypothetical protein
MSSGEVHWQGGIWRANATQPGDGDPITVSVSSLSGSTWHLQGQVTLRTSGDEPQAGDLGTTAQSLYVAGLTGATTPDFVMVTEGATFSPWFSVISSSAGRWHLDPVDFGYGPLLGVPAKVKVQGRLLRVEVDGEDGYGGHYATVGWYGYSAGAFSAANPPGATPPCDTKHLGGVPSTNGAPVPPAHYACQDGWALLSGTFQQSPYLELMNWQAGPSGWQEVETGPLIDESPMWFGLPLPTLQHLGAVVGGPALPVAAAAAVVARYPEAALAGYGVELPALSDSGVVYQYSQDWLAVGSYASSSVQNGLDVSVYRWAGSSWTMQGMVHIADFYGQLDASESGAAVVPESLTGGPAPDFTISGSGADTHWFADVSDIGGKWQGVPFDYGSKPTMAIDENSISGGLVEGELDYCGCAVGPESELWYQYSAAQREFLPTNPPGPAAPCTEPAIHQAVVVADVNFTRVACVDGWAVGFGTEGAVSVVVLLQEQGTSWQPVNMMSAPVVNAQALSAVTHEYLVPASVRAKLATGLHIA